MDPPDDFGIGLVGTANGNVVEENLVTANTNGIYIAAAVGRNTVRANTVLGNPAIQSIGTRPEVRALDIVNLSPANQTVLDRNRCVTSLNAPCPVIVSTWLII